MEPTHPLRRCSYFNAAFPSFGEGPVTSQNPLYWFIWPTFSSSVILASNCSTFCSISCFLSMVFFFCAWAVPKENNASSSRVCVCFIDLYFLYGSRAPKKVICYEAALRKEPAVTP